MLEKIYDKNIIKVLIVALIIQLFIIGTMFNFMIKIKSHKPIEFLNVKISEDEIN